MAFNATCIIDGTKFKLNHFSWSLSRMTDHTGRPQSEVSGGLVNIVFEREQDMEDTFLMRILDENSMFKGTVEFERVGEEGVQKTFTFEDAFLISYSEDCASMTGSPSMVSTTISATKLGYDDKLLVNPWEVKA